jgi:hypothetical protein
MGGCGSGCEEASGGVSLTVLVRRMSCSHLQVQVKFEAVTES